jgi:uncharacterized protein
MLEPLQRPVWKEPMVWLIAGLPATVVVASFVTYYIAATNPDPLVNAGYHKEGLAPVQDTSKYQRAAELAINGELVIRDGVAEISLTERMQVLPTGLDLLLQHPSDAAQDAKIVLSDRGAGLYAGLLPGSLSGKRQWILEPEDRSWRLSGDLALPLTKPYRLSNY